MLAERVAVVDGVEVAVAVAVAVSMLQWHMTSVPSHASMEMTSRSLLQHALPWSWRMARARTWPS